MNELERICKEHGIKTSKYWLKMLANIDPQEIGVVKASGKLLSEENMRELCNEMAVLSKAKIGTNGHKKGIILPLAFGNGIKLDDYSKKKVKGLRVSPKTLIDAIVPLVKESQSKLVETLKASGCDAVAIPPEYVKVVPHGFEIDKNGQKVDMGYVGDITAIYTKPIISAIKAHKVPVLSHLGVCNGEYYNINATTVAKELVKFLQAKKLVIVGDTPIRNKNGKIISAIYSELEFKQLVSSEVIEGGMITNGQESYELLNYLGPGHCVQITALKFVEKHLESTGLLEEILGDGSGTKLMTPSVITTYPLNAVSTDFLTGLINDIFSEQSKKLCSGYFKDLASKDSTIYLDTLKAGGAITYPFHDTEYICKFFTHQDYTGIGIGTSVMEKMLLQKDSLVWRTSKTNKDGISFYDKMIKHYNGVKKAEGEYVVYGINVPKNRMNSMAKEISKFPKTFEKIGA